MRGEANAEGGSRTIKQRRLRGMDPISDKGHLSEMGVVDPDGAARPHPRGFGRVEGGAGGGAVVVSTSATTSASDAGNGAQARSSEDARVLGSRIGVRGRAASAGGRTVVSSCCRRVSAESWCTTFVPQWPQRRSVHG